MKRPRIRDFSVPEYDPAIARFLEEVYGSCNRGVRLRRDPLALVVEYPDPRDRELTGLVASTLAFGSVDLILRAVREVLLPLGPHPATTLAGFSEQDIAETWAGFQYRYCFPKDIIALLLGAKRAQERAGSLEAFFLAGDPGGEDIVEAAGAFVRGLKALAPGIRKNLLPEPARGSACKRLFLYLRWMIREDDVDPGGWKGLSPDRLLVPLDTHMARVCAERLHFIPRPQADLRSALAATAAFKLYAPDDPVKYDFALTRPGIDPEPGDERFGCT